MRESNPVGNSSGGGAALDDLEDRVILSV